MSETIDPRTRLVVGALCASAVAHAAHLAWLCDDAFISFRYARNLVRGHGLVFNPGEAVEGYTNFLWTLAMAGGMKAGISPEALAPTLGLGAFVAVLATLWIAGRALAAELGAGSGTAAMAAVCFAAWLPAREWATSGLETMAFTALAWGAVLGALMGRGRNTPLWVGGLAAMACLTRPEGALFAGMAVVALLGTRRAVQNVAQCVGVLVVIVGPYAAWKLHFYGDLLPNTFYAKAAGNHWLQGAIYLGICLVGALPLACTPLAIAARIRHSVLCGAERARGMGSLWALCIVALCTGAYLLHLWRAGGGFMYARLLVPAVPGLLLLLTSGVAVTADRRLRAVLSVGAMVGFAAIPTPPSLFDKGDQGMGWAGVVDERSWYPDRAIDEAIAHAAVLRPMLAGTQAQVAIFGSQAMLAYYADLPIAVESDVGLTDAEVARLPSPPGARPGHGPKADAAYLTQRGVQLMMRYRWPDPEPDPGALITFAPGVTGRVLARDPALLAHLAAQGATGPGLAPTP